MDMDHAVREIDVDPREVQRFIEPQAGADEDGDEGPDVVVASAEELLDLQILDQLERVLGASACSTK
jgi:hypothetical protein